MSQKNKKHQAVLIEEVIKYLAPRAGHYYLDATFGRGGHSGELLKRGAKVIAFDCDQEVIERAQSSFSKELKTGQLRLLNENFNKMEEAISNLKKSLDIDLAGILFDFGTSTDQLMSSERGFSFNADENDRLDMRMDQRLGVKAADLLKVLNEKQLVNLLFEYGGERDARRIAREVKKIKQENPEKLDYSQTLIEIVEKIKGNRRGHLHPATKTFQALRIAVNDEIDSIRQVLPQALALLQASNVKDKRLVSIAFHEGEDRLVKAFFRKCQTENLAKILTKKPVTAGEAELKENPRSRSAKLRALAI